MLSEWPRERLLTYGARQLSIQELISVVLATGNKSKSVFELSSNVSSILLGEARAALESDLSLVAGLGLSQRARLLASLELGRRYSLVQRRPKVKISSPKEALEFITPYLSGLNEEHFYVAILSVKNRVLRLSRIAAGQSDAVHVSMRDLFSSIVLAKGSGFVCYHNHPSGDPEPSPEDNVLTKKIKAIAKIMDLRFVDHVIYCEKSGYSYNLRRAF